MEAFEVIRRYAGMLDTPVFTERAGFPAVIVLKRDRQMLCAQAEGAWRDLQENNVKDISDAADVPPRLLEFCAAFALLPRTAAVVSAPPYASICLDANREIQPVLDDMAQIIGGSCTVVKNDRRQIGRALRRRDAVLIKGLGLAATGHNLYEAVCAAVITEKSAEVQLKAPVIGGAKCLSGRDVRRMRSFYLHRYSRAERAKNDAAEE